MKYFAGERIPRLAENRGLVRNLGQDVRHHDVGHGIGERAGTHLDQHHILHPVVTRTPAVGTRLQRIRRRQPIADEQRPELRGTAAVDERDQIVEGSAGSVTITVGGRALGDQSAVGRILKCGLVELLDIGTERLGLGEDPLALRRNSFRKVLNIDGGMTLQRL